MSYVQNDPKHSELDPNTAKSAHASGSQNTHSRPKQRPRCPGCSFSYNGKDPVLFSHLKSVSEIKFVGFNSHHEEGKYSSNSKQFVFCN